MKSIGRLVATQTRYDITGRTGRCTLNGSATVVQLTLVRSTPLIQKKNYISFFREARGHTRVVIVKAIIIEEKLFR